MPIATTLNLVVTDYKDANHWYWRLTDANGHFLADREVRLDTTDSEYEGFLDLPVYLAMHAAPDRRREDEARLVRRLPKRAASGDEALRTVLEMARAPEPTE